MNITVSYLALSEVCEALQQPLNRVLPAIKVAGLDVALVSGRVSLTADQVEVLRQHFAKLSPPVTSSRVPGEISTRG